jgi:hypothetical protein
MSGLPILWAHRWAVRGKGRVYPSVTGTQFYGTALPVLWAHINSTLNGTGITDWNTCLAGTIRFCDRDWCKGLVLGYLVGTKMMVLNKLDKYIFCERKFYNNWNIQNQVSKVLMSVSAIIINASNIPAVSCIKVDYDQMTRAVGRTARSTILSAW